MREGVTGRSANGVSIRCWRPNCNVYHSGSHEIDGETFASGLCFEHCQASVRAMKLTAEEYIQRVRAFWEATKDVRAAGYLELRADFDQVGFNVTRDPRHHAWYPKGQLAMLEWEGSARKKLGTKAPHAKMNPNRARPKQRQGGADF